MENAKVVASAFLFFLAAGCHRPEPTASCGINFCLPEGSTFADVRGYDNDFIYMALPGDGTGIIIVETDEEDWPLGAGPVGARANGTPLPVTINDSAQLFRPTIQSEEPSAAVEMDFPDSPSPHLMLSGFCDSQSSCVIAEFAKKLRPRQVR